MQDINGGGQCVPAVAAALHRRIDGDPIEVAPAGEDADAEVGDGPLSRQAKVELGPGGVAVRPELRIAIPPQSGKRGVIDSE